MRLSLETIVAQSGLASVVLDIEVTNARSLRLAERLGAEPRLPVRVEVDRNGVPRTLQVFVIPVGSSGPD